MQHHYIEGGNGLKLYVEEGGNRAGPSILFIHGYTSAGLAWANQMHSELLGQSFRLVSFDIRGHGQSEKPTEPEAYTTDRLWAEDVAAIIERLELVRPVLVGWSYGGYIICDYLQQYGQDNVGGINFVAAATKMGGKEALSLLGREFTALTPGFFSNDVLESITALQKLIGLLTYQEQSLADFYEMLGYNASVPPYVRQALFSRRVNNDDLLAEIKIPVLLTHGTADRVILLAASEHYARLIGGAKTSLYPETGHSTALEDPTRFNTELAAFVRECGGRSSF